MGCSWTRDECGRKRDLQLGTSQDLGAERRPLMTTTEDDTM
jgi:hypothetical protein